MKRRPDRLNFRGALLVATFCVALSACAMHWPWKRQPKPLPPAVHYVTVLSQTGAITQYWDRNTLQLDLTGVSGEGQATLSPIQSVGWPIRLEFMVRPGSFGQLEVLAAQRVLFQIPAQGKNLILKLSPGVYAPDTQNITVRWSAADGSAH